MPIGPLERLSSIHILALVALVAVAAGAIAAPQVHSAVTGPDGTVAVVELDGTIDQQTAQDFEAEMREARHNDSIEAVVLDVDSGGGLPAESERIAAAVERTADEMPVIASVDTAGASGAYLAMAPADDIYVAPSAQAVGSVGVVGPGPMPTGPSEGVSGPDKQGPSPDEHRMRSQTLANLFLEHVIEHRGDEIELDREEIAHADAYLGTEAVDNGFADDFGYVDDAIETAAAEAGLDSYDVVTHETGGAGSQPLLLSVGDDGDTVEVTDSDGLNANFVLAVAPQFWDESVDGDVSMGAYVVSDGQQAETVAVESDDDEAADDSADHDDDGADAGDETDGDGGTADDGGDDR